MDQRRRRTAEIAAAYERLVASGDSRRSTRCLSDEHRRPAATRPEIEQAPVVLMHEPHWVLDRVFDVRVDDAVFTR